MAGLPTVIVILAVLLLGAGAYLSYRSHPNQGLADRPLAFRWQVAGHLLMVIGIAAWVAQAGWRTGLLVALTLLMLLLGALPFVGLARRRGASRATSGETI